MRSWWIRVVAAVVVCLAIGGVAGFVIARTTNVTVLTGSFYVGDHEATAAVGGSAYGVSESVPWVDATNTWHEDGWPACLAPVGATRTATFGVTTINGPFSSWPEVVWVSCPT